MGVWGCGLGTELDSYDLSHAWMLESFGEAHMTGLGSGILIIETDNVHQASHHLRILATKKSHVSLSVLMALIQVKSLITRSTVSFFFFLLEPVSSGLSGPILPQQNLIRLGELLTTFSQQAYKLQVILEPLASYILFSSLLYLFPHPCCEGQTQI